MSFVQLNAGKHRTHIRIFAIHFHNMERNNGLRRFAAGRDRI